MDWSWSASCFQQNYGDVVLLAMTHGYTYTSAHFKYSPPYLQPSNLPFDDLNFDDLNLMNLMP